MNAEQTKVASKHGRRWIALGAVATLLLAGAGFAWYGGLFHLHGAGEDATGEQYTCGMHPWIITDKPGDCPICGMKLTKIVQQPGANQALRTPTSASARTASRSLFRAAMRWRISRT